MSKIYAPLVGLTITLLSIFAPIFVFLALPFIKWDKELSLDRHNRDSAIRGDLPRWLSWLSTPDERLPGGLYEPNHKKLYEKYGKYFASWYWLGFRNTLFGMAMAAGKPTTDYIPDHPLGLWERDDVWQHTSRPFGGKLKGIKFVLGYKVYKLLDSSFLAAPVCTVNWRPHRLDI